MLVAGWPGVGGLAVSATIPKGMLAGQFDAMLPPSGAVTVGFWTVSGELKAVPLALKTWISGPTS